MERMKEKAGDPPTFFNTSLKPLNPSWFQELKPQAAFTEQGFLPGKGARVETGQVGERLGWPRSQPGVHQDCSLCLPPSHHLQAQATEAQLTAPAEKPPQHGPLRGAPEHAQGAEPRSLARLTSHTDGVLSLSLSVI